MSANPVLSVVADQFVDEGTLLSITDIGTFTDVVEGSSSGGTIGLDPSAFTPLGAFDPATDVVIDTTALTISGGFSGTGTTVTADVGNGTFEIAVFTFNDFELDLGRTITATGSRPFALLSQSDMDVNGVIDASAPPANLLNQQHVPGPGGGAGGDNDPSGARNGDPAAGAPLLGGGQLGSSAPSVSGAGGGFGGEGGLGENSTGSTEGVGGIAYADLATAIQGGSGGSAASRNSNGNLTGGDVMTGGGGGGGVELGAAGTVTISGEVRANGGMGRNVPSTSSYGNGAWGGGGGAGGGILVHGNDLDIDSTGILTAKGGNGGSHSSLTGAGGGGGGGAVLLAYGAGGSIVVDGTVDVSGGLRGAASQGSATDGAPGVYAQMQQGSGSTPIIEAFDYVIDWGDDSTDDADAATIDTPGVNIGDLVVGSFDGSHAYDDDGVYIVTVTINDDSGGTDTDTFMVTVANIAPTLAISGAANVDEGSLYTLNLSSSDPGDDTITQWTINWGDATQIVPGNPASVTHTYDDGAAGYIITATATDEDGTYAAGNTVAVTVDNVVPTVNAGGPYITFDDVPIVLNGSATDPAGANDPLTFEWDLDGDGDFGETGTNAMRGDEIGVNPTYDPNGLPTSMQTVELRVDDGDGGVTTVSTTVDILGQGTALIGGVLYVIGSNTCNDIAIISQCDDDISVLATFNDSNPATFSAASVTEIVVRTRGGHDIAITTPSVDKLMTIDGGSGNDLLVGGSGRNVISGGTGHDVLFGGTGDDVLLGEDGDDDLFGRSGKDVLVGGNGRDYLDGGSDRDVIIGGQDEDFLYGGGGEDVLVGGWTIHDNDISALDAIMAIWGSAASFDSRVASLTGSGGLLEAGVAVFDDDDFDVLIGGWDRDLVFGDTNPWDGTIDLIALQWSQDVLVAVN